MTNSPDSPTVLPKTPQRMFNFSNSSDWEDSNPQLNKPWAPQDVCNSNYFPYEDFTQLQSVRGCFIFLYSAVIVLSVLGNMMVILTVWQNKHMRTVTNYYIVNLAVSDLLVAVFVMPLKLLEYTAPCRWMVFNKDALCSFLYFILPVFVFASVLTLVAISIERYYAIVHPLDAMAIHSKSRTKKILVATWVIPLVFASPFLFCKSYPFLITSHMGMVSRQICTDRFDDIDMLMYGLGVIGRFRKGFFLFLFCAIYLIPLVAILTTCVRIAICLLQPIPGKHPYHHDNGLRKRREENKRKVARMIIVVAVAFIVAWSPFYLVTFTSQVQTDSFLKHSNFLFTMLATHLFGFLNSCINPFIYNFMSEKFRKSFRQILQTLCCPGQVDRLTHGRASLMGYWSYTGRHSDSNDSSSADFRTHNSSLRSMRNGVSGGKPCRKGSPRPGLNGACMKLLEVEMGEGGKTVTRSRKKQFSHKNRKQKHKRVQPNMNTVPNGCFQCTKSLPRGCVNDTDSEPGGSPYCNENLSRCQSQEDLTALTSPTDCSRKRRCTLAEQEQRCRLLRRLASDLSLDSHCGVSDHIPHSEGLTN